MTIKNAKIYIRKELSEFYPENEITAFISIIFSELFGLTTIQLILKENDSLTETEYDTLKNTINRLKNQEPLQYIIGQTEFFSLKFNVSPAVLIPRSETEELVDLIIQENRNKAKLSILDIGTGSACIAVALAKNLSNATVFALDISLKALKLAQKNASYNDVNIAFIQEDILNFDSNKRFANQTFNIIVSNPPYVRVSEKQQMSKNVLAFEPETALFVDDNNPLVFYKAITCFAKQHLSVNGKLYFEINEQFGNDVKALLLSSGFSDVEIIKDINGRDRIASSIIRQAQ